MHNRAQPENTIRILSTIFLLFVGMLENIMLYLKKQQPCTKYYSRQLRLKMYHDVHIMVDSSIQKQATHFLGWKVQWLFITQSR